MNCRTKLIVILAAETFLFAIAALVHADIAFSGYEHTRAATAESVIAVVLAAGLAVAIVLPRPMAVIALAVQAFALLGTLVGAFTIAVGVGPQTRVDTVFHIVLLAVLCLGVITAWKTWRWR